MKTVTNNTISIEFLRSECEKALEFIKSINNNDIIEISDDFYWSVASQDLIVKKGDEIPELGYGSLFDEISDLKEGVEFPEEYIYKTKLISIAFHYIYIKFG